MADNQWFIRDVDEAVKRKIKAYAAANGIMIAEAVKRLVEAGEKALEGEK